MRERNTERTVEDIVASQLVCSLARAVPPAEVPYRLPWPGGIAPGTVPVYLLEVTAPVRLEPAVLQTRRAAFEAIRHIESILRQFGFFPSPGGNNAVITLTVARGSTQRVRVVRRYRATGGDLRCECT